MTYTILLDVLMTMGAVILIRIFSTNIGKFIFSRLGFDFNHKIEKALKEIASTNSYILGVIVAVTVLFFQIPVLVFLIILLLLTIDIIFLTILASALYGRLSSSKSALDFRLVSAFCAGFMAVASFMCVSPQAAIMALVLLIGGMLYIIVKIRPQGA